MFRVVVSVNVVFALEHDELHTRFLLKHGFSDGLHKPGALFQHGALFQILGEASPAQVLLDGQKLAEVADLDALEKAPAGFAHTAGPAPTLWVKVPPSSVVKRVLITKQ